MDQNVSAQELLRCAAALFAKKGFDATSTREIVELAGVTKPMLYYYFGSKEGIRRAVFEFHLVQFHERLRAVVDGPTPAEELLVDVVWIHLEYCRDHADFARLFYATYFGPDDTGLDLDAHAQMGWTLVRRAVEKVQRAGKLKPGSVDDLTTALHGMINIWVISALKREAPLTRALAAKIVTGLLQGYRKR